MKDDIFNNVLVPEFIRALFNTDDWYLSISKSQILI